MQLRRRRVFEVDDGLRLTYAFASYGGDEAPAVGAVMADLATFWKIYWLSVVWDSPERPQYHRGLDSAPEALHHLRTKAVATVDPRLPGVIGWLASFAPYSNSVDLRGRGLEVGVADGDTVIVGASRADLGTALRRSSMRELSRLLRIEVRSPKRAPEADATRCLACGHDWGDHFPASDACAQCERGAAQEPFLSPCRLAAEHRTSRA